MKKGFRNITAILLVVALCLALTVQAAFAQVQNEEENPSEPGVQVQMEEEEEPEPDETPKNLEKTKKWLNSPGNTQFPHAEAIILDDYIEMDYDKDSSRTLVEHEVIKLLNKNAYRKYHMVRRSYVAPHQSIDVEVARIIKPNGDIINIDKDKRIKREAMFAKQFPLYRDLYILTLDFSRAREGDIIEFKIVRKDKDPMMKDNFWAISFTRDEVPLMLTTFVVKVLKPGVKIFYYTPRMDDGKMKPKETSEGGGKAYSWTLKNRDPLAMEPGAPPFKDWVSSVMVSTFPSMEKMSEDYYKVFEPYVDPGDKVKAKAAELVKNARDDRDKIIALADYIHSKKYIDIGFEPDQPILFKSEVLLETEKMTSKDAQMLFISLLRGAGLKAYPALMSDQKNGAVYPQIATPYQFNRLVTMVELNGKQEYLDVTDAVSKKLSLYAGKQGVDILPLTPQGSKLARTPVSPPEDNMEEINVSAELSADGSLGAKMILKETGIKKAFWESFMKIMDNPFNRGMMFSRLIKLISDDAKVIGSEVNRDEDKDEIEMEVTFMTENYPLVSGKFWILQLPTIPANQLPDFIVNTTGERKQPVMLGGTGTEKKTINLTLPEGCKVMSLPGKVNLDNEVGSLNVDCKQEGNKIDYSYELKIKKMMIPVSLYPDMRKLYETSVKSSKEVILLQKEDKSKGSDVGKM